MELFCIGDASFCELFSFAGAGYRICTDAADAAKHIASRPSKDEIILVSESLLAKKSAQLERVMSEPGRVIVPVPSPSSERGENEARAALRRLLGGA